MDRLIKLLRQNARMTDDELAVMLDTSAEEVRKMIDKLENDGILKGYSAIIDDSKYDPNSVYAMIELGVTPQSQSGYEDIARQIASYDEVASVRLMSGTYDILVEVRGANIRDVSLFVSQRLATIDAVQSTATHFVLKAYKDNGIIIDGEEKDERSWVCP